MAEIIQLFSPLQEYENKKRAHEMRVRDWEDRRSRCHELISEGLPIFKRYKALLDQGKGFTPLTNHLLHTSLDKINEGCRIILKEED